MDNLTGLTMKCALASIKLSDHGIAAAPIEDRLALQRYFDMLRLAPKASAADPLQPARMNSLSTEQIGRFVAAAKLATSDSSHPLIDAFEKAANIYHASLKLVQLRNQIDVDGTDNPPTFAGAAIEQLEKAGYRVNQEFRDQIAGDVTRSISVLLDRTVKSLPDCVRPIVIAALQQSQGGSRPA
jgi:hypothetical protein